MTILFDTNVVLDVLLARDPFKVDPARLFAAAETGKVNGFLCATTITTIHYVAGKSVGKSKAAEHLGSLLSIFQIASVTPAVIRSALSLDFTDFEDAVLHEAAKSIGAEGIVTRNSADFVNATIPVFESPQLVRHLEL